MGVKVVLTGDGDEFSSDTNVTATFVYQSIRKLKLKHNQNVMFALQFLGISP